MNKNVLNKLAKINSKVELSEVRVDLALADDVKKAYADAIAARKKSYDEMQLLAKKVQETTKMIQGYIAVNRDAISTFLKFEDAAKSIGIPVPKEIVDQQKNISEGLKRQLPDFIKTLQGIKIF